MADFVLKNKLKRLREIIRSLSSLLVAYSGGVDSSLLAKVAANILGDNLLAVLARSPTYTSSELIRAKEFVRRHKIKFLTIKTNELDSPWFCANTRNRCYYCKRELFLCLQKIAAERRIKYIADGANYDDRRDYRPGARAAKECKVRSPLQEAGLTKKDIRSISRRMGLSTWNQPSLACLASRLPYGQNITPAVLKRVESAEEFLRGLGFSQVRVRHYDNLARIEIETGRIADFTAGLRAKVVFLFKKLGYDYVTLDLEGYRSGSMNEPFFSGPEK